MTRTVNPNSTQMAIITLTSDLGTSDHYVAVLKGRLYSALPDVRIVDISHDIPKYDLPRAIFVLKQTWHHFPPNTIHLVGVESLETEQASLVAVRLGGHFFIGADNGMLSLISQEMPDEAVMLELTPGQKLSSFPMFEVFIPAAAHLAEGGKITELGKSMGSIRRGLSQMPPQNAEMITANVAFIDSFGNLITNVDRALFDRFLEGRPFRIALPGKRDEIMRINKSYTESAPGSPMALFGFSGQLEIAIAQGSAHKLLGLKLGDSIRIHIDD